MASVDDLRARIEATLVRLDLTVNDFVAGPTATDHELRILLPATIDPTPPS